MKIKKINELPYKPLIVSAFVLIVVALGVAYFYQSGDRTSIGPVKNNNSSDTRIDLEEPTSDQINAGNNSKKQVVENDLKNNAKNSMQMSTQLTITSTNASTSTLQIRVLIQDIVSDGTCSLKMTNDKTNAVVAQSADVQPLPGGAACKGFDVALDQLKDSTSWNIHVDYVGDKFSGETSKDITVSR